MRTEYPLAPCVKGTVKFGSLGGSHTNQVLRLFLANVKDWSEDALKKHDPEFHRAVVHGMEWTVLSADLLKAFPKIAQYVQESSNTGGQLQRREGEMQMARRVYNLWASLSVDGRTAVKYAEIKSKLLRSRPSCGSSLPHVYTFLLRFSGGSTAEAFWETETWVKANCPSGKVLGPQIWDAVSCEQRTGAPLAKLRHAILRLGYTGPLEECRVSVGCVKRLLGSGMREKSEAAENLFGLVRSLCSSGFLAPDLRSHILEFEMLVVEILLDRRSVKHIPTMEHAAKLLVDKLVGLGAPKLSSQWDKFVVEAKSSAGQSTDGDGEVQLLGQIGWAFWLAVMLGCRARMVKNNVNAHHM